MNVDYSVKSPTTQAFSRFSTLGRNVAAKCFVGLLALTVALAVSGCVGPTNDKIATYEKIGDRYLIEISGTRLAMVHDLKDVLPLKTYKLGGQFELPRIEGKIDGGEIAREPGSYKLVGSILIHDKKMIINLSADNYDFNRLDPSIWNGNYTLIEKKN